MDLDLSLAAPDLTAQLVDIESVSGAEKPLADAIEAALRPLPHLAVHRDGNVIVARTSLGRDQRVVLAGHIDTVPVRTICRPAWNADVLYGCGTSDMKSGVAVQLRLAALVPEPNRDVTYVFYDCEEVEAERNGLLRLSREQPGPARRRPGRADGADRRPWSRAAARARCAPRSWPAASARTARRSWLGVNAIHEAGRILDVLRGLPACASPTWTGSTYHEGLNAVLISGRGGRERDPGRVRGHGQLPVRARPLGRAGRRSRAGGVRRAARCG